MSLVQTIQYDMADDFTFDTNKIEVASMVARLKLIPNAGQTFSQPFSSDSGFTYDATKTEFTAGVLRQLDKRPANATFYASFASSINANWSTGVGTGTATGGAAIAGGKLDLKGASGKYLTFSGGGNLPLGDTGCIRVRFTPNYNGTPTGNQTIFSIGDQDSGNNRIEFLHLTNGSLFMYVNDENGNNVLSNSLLSFDAEAGVTGELEVNWDMNAGKFYILGSGFLLAEIDVSMVRSGLNNILRFGAAVDGNNLEADHSMDGVAIYDTVQHTGNYTPPIELPDTAYVSDLVTLPTLTYSGLGSLLAFTVAAFTVSGSPRFILNSKYWNGSAWVTSNDSYAQANSAAQVIANIGTLTAANTLIVKVVTAASNTQSVVDLMTITYSGQIYPSDSPYITINSGVDTDGLTSFEADFTGTVKFVLVIGGVPKYWNGTTWATSNNTFAQSNTVSEINTNLATLDLSLGVTYKLRAFLNSDGSSTPTITSAETGYNFFVVPVAEPNRCVVYAFLNDLMGIVGAEDSAVMILELPKPFEHGDRIILPFKRTFVFTTLGYVESSPSFLNEEDADAGEGIIETESVNLSPYTITLQYLNDANRRTRYRFKNVQIPNVLSVNLVDLVSV